MSWFSRSRTSGYPTSSNRASSLHLFWSGCDDYGYAAIAATFEVLVPPAVPELYFWALQAGFVGPGGADAGAGHTGLQWHPGHPGSTALNWGGYEAAGGELPGSASALPSAMHNVNTRDFVWRPQTPYRIRIAQAPDDVVAPAGRTAWRATVCDLSTGTTTVARDLYAAGMLARSPMVWSEVFAPCDAPTVIVRWSDFTAETPDGDIVTPTRMVVNYQSYADGGCDTSSNERDPDVAGAFRQVTGGGVPRALAQGSVVDL